MREKKAQFIVTFATTTAAMAMEQLCKARQLQGRLIPVPRSIRAGCGMCWLAPLEAREQLEALVVDQQLAVDGLYVKEI